MRAVVLNADKYRTEECTKPTPADNEVLIKVAYSGVNRADLFQKQGKYPLPQASPAIPGLEVAGEIVACGKQAGAWKVGDKVCALLTEGGFSEYVCANLALVLPLGNLTVEQGAALPEAMFTAWISFAWQAKLQPGETVLIHGGASGIGTIAIQLARFMGARVFATAGTDEKCTLCERLGAEKAINYKNADYVKFITQATADKGVDVILDMVGGDYFERNLECLGMNGRLCIIAFLRGAKALVNLSPVLLKRLTIMGSTLRARPLEEKAQIARELGAGAWAAVAKGAIKPVIDQIFALEEAEKALGHMDQGLNLGKILLKT